MGRLTASPPEHLPNMEYPICFRKIVTWFLALLFLGWYLVKALNVK